MPKRLTNGDAPVADRVKSLEKDPELAPWKLYFQIPISFDDPSEEVVYDPN